MHQPAACDACGEPYVRRTHNGRYCSRRCAKWVERGRSTDPRNIGRPFDCQQCGQRVIPGDNAAPNAERFCGRRCARAAQKLKAEVRGQLTTEGRTGGLQGLWGAVLRRDPCCYCGGPGGNVDHITPRHLGGPDTEGNLTGACHRCNNRKQTMPLLHFMAWRLAADALEPWHEYRRRLLREHQGQ